MGSGRTREPKRTCERNPSLDERKLSYITQLIAAEATRLALGMEIAA
jgi:hypothetical protein